MTAVALHAAPAAARQVRGRRGVGLAPFPLLLAPMLVVLLASAWLNEATRTVFVLTVVILLGVPHGALDGELARPLLRPRFGPAWFIVFALPYLGLVAGVLVAWRAAPGLTLAIFLAASVWHFGVEDAGERPLAAAARGGLAVAVPVLLHPAATARFLSAVTLTGMPQLPLLLVGCACLWCGVAMCWVMQAFMQRDWHGLADAGLVAGLFTLLLPLPAFAAYFVCLHAPRHMQALVDGGLAPRVRTMREAVWRSLPLTALTLVIGALLWRWFPGAAPGRLLALTIQGLAALTLPHMLLGAWAARHPRSAAGQ